MRIDREDLGLRAENIHALTLAGIDNPLEQLLLLTDIKDLVPFPSHNFALLDHNRLAPSYSDTSSSRVVAVIDHHDDEHLYDDANPRIVAAAGSCSSHVALLCPPELPVELATFLLCAIVIDTAALKPGGKALAVDHDAVAFLMPRSTFKDYTKLRATWLHDIPALKNLDKVLSQKKTDLSHLTPRDLLRRDYKEYTFRTPHLHPSKPTIKAGLSTVPSPLKAWGCDGKLHIDGYQWMKDRHLSILGVLTTFRDSVKKNGKGKHRREMAWIIRTDTTISCECSPDDLNFDQLAAKLWEGLEANKEIALRPHKSFEKKQGEIPSNLKIKLYKQQNADATRKIIAPLLKNIVEA